MHGGVLKVVPGNLWMRKLWPKRTWKLLDKGCENMDKQIENVLMHGVPCIVALNHFPTDTDREVQFVLDRAKKMGSSAAVVSDVWARGGEGGIDLAQAIIDVTEKRAYQFPFPISSRCSNQRENRDYCDQGVWSRRRRLPALG